MYSGFFHNFAFQKKHLFMIPANLTHYIETEIIPRYEKFDKAHNLSHVQAVIKRAFHLPNSMM